MSEMQSRNARTFCLRGAACVQLLWGAFALIMTLMLVMVLSTSLNTPEQLAVLIALVGATALLYAVLRYAVRGRANTWAVGTAAYVFFAILLLPWWLRAQLPLGVSFAEATLEWFLGASAPLAIAASVLLFKLRLLGWQLSFGLSVLLGVSVLWHWATLQGSLHGGEVLLLMMLLAAGTQLGLLIAGRKALESDKRVTGAG